ncbi:hypothetical protein PHYSODRAFT_341432 [Phytophthora sojae]|uniref:Uncharacterized protein n=1 Tax=Phytophthora sojae (strain P6497) TaxID=1094619 RepID=G5AD78_PHYSP|nr:hypothetical protein PHYSODRAFT_341432 [Phytophthora sojae]EGZ06131.1 hypothetical protein PHYSODRAFT_341432 [Phytophthora sojae]|eukprot:XP_009538028.1 hypothetical protein PHYSODRAFT_341432 [Phytophthora sojae]
MARPACKYSSSDGSGSGQPYDLRTSPARLAQARNLANMFTNCDANHEPPHGHGAGAKFNGQLDPTLDSGLDDPTHQWYRIPVSSGYFAFKNGATGKLLDHWHAKEGYGNTVAISDGLKDPNRQWF